MALRGQPVGQASSREAGCAQDARKIGRQDVCPASAFTLLELLTVISILGIIAALAVPALKNFGKVDASLGASQQLLRDVARARQLAIADRTTVYMVFVPMNFWTNTPWISDLNPAQLAVASNLCNYQLSGYTFIASGALGDQPGNHQWHYLAPWQFLPPGNYIATWKFTNSTSLSFEDPVNQNTFKIYSFSYTTNIPFPTETSPTNALLPYIEFNNYGQVVYPYFSSPDQDYTGSGIDIPLVKGNVLPAMDPTTKEMQFATPEIFETPPGNATNISYNVVHIDPLTGRATLLFHQVQ